MTQIGSHGIFCINIKEHQVPVHRPPPSLSGLVPRHGSLFPPTSILIGTRLPIMPHYVCYGALAALSNGLGGCAGLLLARYAFMYERMYARLSKAGLAGRLRVAIRLKTSTHTDSVSASLVRLRSLVHVSISSRSVIRFTD